MKRYIFYTTEKVSKVRPLTDLFAADISRTKGRGVIKIDVVHKIPQSVDTIVDADGDTVLYWPWFRKTFDKSYYDGVIFHFTPQYRKLWGTEPTINGSRNRENKEYPEYWICCTLTKKARGYQDLLEFLRLNYHEHAHFDEDLDNHIGDFLTQNTVHDMDYNLKKIHLYHLLIDYRGKAIKELVDKIIIKTINIIKSYVSNT